MTIVIGVKCEDGVVIGADSTATLGGGLFEKTVEQHEQPKIEIIPIHPIIVAYSGFVGLGQRILLSLNCEWDRILTSDKLTARSIIREAILRVIERDIQIANLTKQLFGQSAIESAICHTLISLPLCGETVLLEYDPTTASEEKTISLPFVSIGSGLKEADVFLAFLKEYLWNNKSPSNLADAKRAIIWAISHVKKVHPGGGIGGDIQVAQLTKDQSGNFKAEFENLMNIEMHLDYIESCKAVLQDYFLDKPKGNNEINEKKKNH